MYVSFWWGVYVFREYEMRSAFLQAPLDSRRAEKSNLDSCVVLKRG